METGKQDSNIKIKECVVKLERLEMDTNDDSSDSTELPILFSTTARKKTRSKKASKSSAELLKEHQNLALNLKDDNESVINIEETIRRLEIVVEPSDDRSSVSSDPPPCEENDVKIFCVQKNLLFFNSRDVTPAQCGYENRCHDSFPVHIFEQQMLSFKWTQFQHVISSFLHSAKECCISDCKSFITFLLRTISIHNDISCISACYRVLVSLLDNHPDSSCLTFSSAEIFMLLFNYGIDIDNFKFLSKWSDIKRELEVPQYPNSNSSGIPDQWLFNLKFILKALTKIISSCTFKNKDMERIIIFFMWMSTDPFLLKENLYSTVRQCIKVCLDNVKDEKWNNIQCNIISDLISLELSTIHEKWATIYEMTESIPNQGTRPIQLRKQISFNSLKCLVGSSQDLDENCLGFSIIELQFVIQQLVEINSEYLKYASKFIDNCVKNLGASKEEYNKFCDILKQCESSLSVKAQTEKTQFLKIYAKLRTFCGQKVSLHERSSVCNLVQIKSECDNNNELSENDYRNSPYDYEINNGKTSVTPGLSENSQNYGINQSDHSNSSYSNENSNEVHVKSEYVDEPCSPETARKASSIKIVLRKKRSSRSSSGNSLVDHSLATSDLNCEDDDLSRQSSEFECQLLNEDLSAMNAVVQNTDNDLVVPAPDFLVSQDFSVEYPEETCNSIKVEPEQYYDHRPVSSEVEKMDIVDNENHRNVLPSTSENYVNESLFEDLSPLPEICEVKSIAFSSMDVENSSVPVPDLPCEPTNNSNTSEKFEQQPSSLEVSHFEDNAMLLNNGISMLHNDLEPEIIPYEGDVLNNFSCIQENIDNISLKQTTSSTHSAHDLLDADEDIVIIGETDPCTKSKTDHTEENIPSPIQRYSEALPELSITPVKKVSPCKNHLTDGEDIIIIKEKTPVKEKNPDIIFLKKIESPSHNKSALSHKTKLKTNIATENAKTRVCDKISAKLNIGPQIEVSKSYIRDQENNSDNDDIVIIDEAVTSKENKSSKIMDNHLISFNNKTVNISHVSSESPSHQCKEVLTSVLKQVDVQKYTFDSQCNASNLQCKDAMLKQTDVKKDTFGSQISEVLNSVVQHVDESVKLREARVSNSCGIDAHNEHLVSDDKNSQLTKKSILDRKNESSDFMIGLSTHSSIVENNLEIGKENPGESSTNVISFHTVSNNPMKFTNKVVNDKLDTSTSSCLNSAHIAIKNVPSNVDDEKDKCNSGIGAIGLINENFVSVENRIVELPPSSQNFINDLQNSNNDNISNIDNQAKKAVKDCLNSALTYASDVTDAYNDLVKSSVTTNELISECGIDCESDVANDLQDSNNDNISDVCNQPMKHIENCLNTALTYVSDVTDASRDLVKSPVATSGLISECGVAKQTLLLGSDTSQLISGSSIYSDSEKSNLDLFDNNYIENQNVDKLTMVISDNNVKTCTVPVGEQIHVSETNPSQNINPFSLACSVSKKSSSSVLDNNETENQNANKLMTLTLDTKAKDCSGLPVHTLDESLLQNNNDNAKVSDNCKKNFKKPLKGNILPVSDENKVPPSSNAKIRLDRDINEMLKSAKKTLRNRKRACMSTGRVAKKSLINKREIQVVKITSGKAPLKTNTSSCISPSSRIRRKRTLSNSYENNNDIMSNIPRKSPRKYSPMKSPLSAKYSSHKSPKHFFDYSHMRRKNVCFKRTSLLSDAGLNLTNVLRERIDSSSTSNQQNNVSNNDDLGIIQLYTDPKRYADKECLIVYETQDIVIVDSD